VFATGGLVFCWIRAQRQPWLRDHYTAGAGCGNMKNACWSDAAAGEATAVERNRAERAVAGEATSTVKSSRIAELHQE
jgi:hypothetical protein